LNFKERFDHLLKVIASERFLKRRVNEIGAILGYTDPGYFNRFFSRTVGLPPGRFRENLLPRSKGRL